MFSNLGLLKSGICPDGAACQRARCLFHHDSEARQRVKTGTKGSSSAAIDPSSTPKKRPSESPTSQTREAPVKKRAMEPSFEIKGTIAKPPQPVVKGTKVSFWLIDFSSHHQATSQPTSTPIIASQTKSSVPAKTTPTQPVAGSSTLVPIVSKTSKVSPHPWADRQKGLRTLHTQYEKLVRDIADCR